jgi:hypothetical protein
MVAVKHAMIIPKNTLIVGMMWMLRLTGIRASDQGRLVWQDVIEREIQFLKEIFP